MSAKRVAFRQLTAAPLAQDYFTHRQLITRSVWTHENGFTGCKKVWIEIANALRESEVGLRTAA
jgi:hypothetical protein